MQHSRCFYGKTGEEEMKAMIKGLMYNMEYNFNVFSTAKGLQSGWMLSRKDKMMKFLVHGQSDCDYAKNTEDWSSILATRVFLEGCPIMF